MSRNRAKKASKGKRLAKGCFGSGSYPERIARIEKRRVDAEIARKKAAAAAKRRATIARKKAEREQAEKEAKEA